MNRSHFTSAKLLACCAAALLMPSAFASATDASYGGSSTMIEAGVDLGNHVEPGTMPALALDAQGSAWVITTKDRSYPTLQRIDPSGRLANLFPLTTLAMPASASLVAAANGDMALCARKRGSFDLQVLRLHVDASSDASLRWQRETTVPAPTTTVDFVTSVQRDVAISPVRCLFAADGSVLMHYLKIGAVSNTLVLHRFLADGTPDTAFGTAGIMQSSSAFNMEQLVQLGSITLVWIAADGAISVVSEGALLQQTANSPVLHPVSLTRIIPPTVTTGTWQIAQTDLSFAVRSFDVFPHAQFADGDDIVFFGQTFGFGAKARGYLRRVNAKTGTTLFTVDDVALPSFGPSQTFAHVALIDGTYLLIGGNGEYQPVGIPDRTARTTTWIKRFGAGSTVHSVAGGMAIDGEAQITPLRAGGFLLAAALIGRKDGATAVPGILRFAPDYLLPRTVEFRDPQRDTYFFTASTDEIEQVWAWIRSGVLAWQAPHEFGDAQSFKTWPQDAPVGQTLRMCRFFIPSLGTHFYSARADECAKYSQAPFAGTFVAEDPQFRVFPTLFDLGLCGADKSTISRLFRPAPHALNHRWVVGSDAARALQAQGWLYEGLVFCQPL